MRDNLFGGEGWINALKRALHYGPSASLGKLPRLLH